MVRFYDDPKSSTACIYFFSRIKFSGRPKLDQGCECGLTIRNGKGWGFNFQVCDPISFN